MEQKDEKMINETGGRTLTKAESIRLKQFALTATEFEQQGYKQENVTISAGKANTIGILIGGAVSLPFAIAFHFMVGYNNHETVPLYLILCPVALIAGIIIHELLHGLGWSFFAKDRFKSISFGVVWSALMPYCTCKDALRKGGYIVGLLMPLVVLGIIPAIVSCFIGSFYLNCFAILMIISAGGDLLVMGLILWTRFEGDVYFVDHPTQIGLVAFVKKDEKAK